METVSVYWGKFTGQTVYEQTQKAVNHAREGKGPYFLEFETYRWREHCGPHFDNDLGYRSENEYLKWKKRCPVENYENYTFRAKNYDIALPALQNMTSALAELRTMESALAARMTRRV